MIGLKEKWLFRKLILLKPFHNFHNINKIHNFLFFQIAKFKNSENFEDKKTRQEDFEEIIDINNGNLSIFL